MPGKPMDALVGWDHAFYRDIGRDHSFWILGGQVRHRVSPALLKC